MDYSLSGNVYRDTSLSTITARLHHDKRYLNDEFTAQN